MVTWRCVKRLKETSNTLLNMILDAIVSLTV